ncbi:MAG: TolC family protein, partial [Acidobacteriota bacterium]
ESLYKLARELSPGLRSHQQLINKAEQASKLARLDYYPDFTLGVQYQDVGLGAPMAPQEGQNTWAVMVSMSLPIWWSKTKAGVNEAEMKESSERFAYTDTENMTLMNVKDTYFRLKTAERQVALYRDSILPRTEQALRVSEEGYRADQVDFLNLIDSQRMLLHFQLAYERALTDLQQNLARLEEIVGGKLPGEKSQ